MTVGISTVVRSSSSRLLSRLNQPILTAGGGLAAAVALPVLERTTISWSLLKWIHLAALALNYWAARQPGRIDGIRSSTQQQQPDATDALGAAVSAELSPEEWAVLQQALSLRRGGTLLTPAGWAFAIWAPIFVGELASTVRGVLLDHDNKNPIADTLQRASAGFIVAQIFQTLWAASFRPKYIIPKTKTTTRSGTKTTTTTKPEKRRFRQWTAYISSFHLTGIAVALSRAHAAYAPSRWSTRPTNNNNNTNQHTTTTIRLTDYLLHLFPLTLHFGWTTAAALVNWNGSLAMDAQSSARHVATAGIASTVLATLVGVGVTVSRRAPVYGAVLAWALLACSDAMHQRMQERERQVRQVQKKLWRNHDTATATKIRHRKGYYGAAVQHWMCRAGAVLTGVVACGMALLQLLQQQQQHSTMGVAP